MIEIGAALDAAIALFRRYKALIAIVPLILALGVQTARIEGFLWFDGFKERLALREAQIAKMEQASADNLAAAMAQVKETEAKARNEAELANAKLETLEADYRSRLAAYSGRMRLDKVCRGTAPTPGENPAPESPDRPGSETGMVAIRQDDLELLVENTARLEAAHQWANGLVDAGLALKPVTAADLPEPAFGQ